MDPTLTIALILAIGWALSYRAKWKRAERQLTHLAAAKDVIHKRAWAAEDQLSAALKKADDTERKWLDMKSRYLDSLDEIAALRDGSAAE